MFLVFLFFSRLLVLYFLSSDKSDFLDNESDKLGSDSRSSSTYSFCVFYLRFEMSIVGVSGSGVFSPIGVESKGVIFAYDVFVPIGV